MTTKCCAIAKSGSRCATAVVAGSRYCYLHDPAMADRRRDAAVKGGKARSNKARAAALVPATMTSQELGGWLSLLFRQTMVGKIEPKVATACATLARTLLVVHETAEIERRLDELEQAFGDRRIA